MNTMRLLFFLVLVVSIVLFYRASSPLPANESKNVTDEAVKSDKTTNFSPAFTNSNSEDSGNLENQSDKEQLSQQNEKWIYPGASGKDGVFISVDDPQKVTTWYKDKLSSNGYTIKTFIQTKTNGNTENKLFGSDDSDNISIAITRNTDALKTIIHIK